MTSALDIAHIAQILRAVLGALRAGGRWLLVFDNAERPGDVLGWLPGSGRHVLITSRERGWAEVAVPVEVDVLARADQGGLQLHRLTQAIVRDRLGPG